MKKFCPFFNFLLFLTLILVFPYPANAVWTKYVGNPLINKGNQGEWNEHGSYMPSVIYDEGIYKMWFAGDNYLETGVGYATSLDGKSWDIYNLNPIIKPVYPDKYFSESSVLKENNIYKMWLTVVKASGESVIHYFTSDDGIKWNKIGEPVLKPDAWETKHKVACPNVIKKGSSYLMWYCGNDGLWKIGYAESLDGKIWQKHSTPVISATENWEGLDTVRPSVVYYDNHFEIFYHAGNPTIIAYAISNDGINWTKPKDNPVFGGGPQVFDSTFPFSPMVIKSPDSSKLIMWYSGSDGLNYTTGLATYELPNPSNPTLNPIVIIPGMFGSFNAEAIAEGKEVPQSDWIMTPFYKDWDGIIQTLKNAGYSDDPNDPKQNLFVFNYDWRKKVSGISTDLQKYIQDKVTLKNGDKKIYLIGHSLGGLVGRTYLQNGGKDRIEQLITLGSPHSGAVQAYKAWEGGEYDSSNQLEKVIFKLIIGLNRKYFRTNKDTIQEIAPVIHDLLPTFDYLTDKKNNPIPVNLMKEQNTWLTSLNSEFSTYFDKFYAIYGETGNTPERFKITKPNIIDTYLGLWKDGKPDETINSIFGDETVLSKSATVNADPAYLLPGVNHRDLVSDKKSIEQIIKMLELNINSNDIIISPPKKPIFPALVIALHSPAELEVNGPGFPFPDSINEKKFIFIPNATAGTYQIKVKGTDSGIYHLTVGELFENKDIWKEITQETKTGNEDKYTINLSQNNSFDDPFIDPNGSLHLNNANQIIKELKQKYPHWSLSLAENSINKAEKQYNNKYYNSATFLFKDAIKYLNLYRQRNNSIIALNQAFEVMDNLIYTYDRFFSNNNPKLKLNNLQAEIIENSALAEAKKNKLNKLGNEKSAQTYLLAEDLLGKAKEDLANKLYYRADIELYITKLLLLEI